MKMCSYVRMRVGFCVKLCPYSAKSNTGFASRARGGAQKILGLSLVYPYSCCAVESEIFLIKNTRITSRTVIMWYDASITAQMKYIFEYMYQSYI